MPRVLRVLCLVVAVGLVPSFAEASGRVIRGDTDGNGTFSVTDAVQILRYLFRGEDESPNCPAVYDTDESDDVTISDAVVLLQYLFSGERAPSVPSGSFGYCRFVPLSNALPCHESTAACVPTYFLRELHSDAVFFVCDRSEFIRGNGELGAVKQELSRAVLHCDGFSEFGIVFHDDELLTFPQDRTPGVGTPESRVSAASFVNDITGGDRRSCVEEAISAAISMAELSGAETKEVIYSGVGRGACGDEDEAEYLEGALGRLAVQAGDVPIHVVEIFGTEEDSFLSRLAARTGGSYFCWCRR
ncbi:MAG: dockerin type I repeat-containing protein [Planctomycetota bacterium]